MKVVMNTKCLLAMFLMLVTGVTQAAIIDYQVTFTDKTSGVLTLDVDLQDCSGICPDYTYQKDDGLNAFGWKYQDSEWFVDFNDPLNSTALPLSNVRVTLTSQLYFSWASEASDLGLYISFLNLPVFPSLDASLYHAFRGGYFYEPYLPEGATLLSDAVEVYRYYSSINEIEEATVEAVAPSHMALMLLGLVGLGTASRQKFARN